MNFFRQYAVEQAAGNRFISLLRMALQYYISFSTTAWLLIDFKFKKVHGTIYSWEFVIIVLKFLAVFTVVVGESLWILEGTVKQNEK